MVVPVVDCGFGSPNGFCQGQFWTDCSWRDDGQSCAQRATVKSGVEDGGSQAFGGEAIAPCLGNSGDQAMQTQAPQVVGDLSRSQLAPLFSEQWSEMLADVFVDKRALDEEKQQCRSA